MAKVKVKQRESLSDIFRNIASGVTGFFVFIILTIFPLYTHEMYFDILKSRYVFFKVWALSLIFILIGLGIAYLFIDYNNESSSPSAIERLLNAFKLENLKKHIILTDIFFVAMLLVVIISALGSNFKEEAFFGTSGRYQGTECWIIYFLVYLAITRTFKFKIMYIDFALLSGAFSCIWGTLDFFYIDPFRFFVNVGDLQKGMFASSVGNLNTYTNYTIMVFALAAALFMVERDKWKTVFYGIMAFIGCAGSIFGLADNIVLGFFGFYLFAPLFIINNRRHLVRYLILICIMLVSMHLLWLGLKVFHNPWQGSFFIDFVSKPVVPFLFIPVILIIVAVSFLLYKMKPSYGDMIETNLTPFDSILSKKIKIVYLAIILVGFLTITYILLDMNVFKQHVDLWAQIPSSHQLKLNDDWGSHRGHNWRIAFTNFTQNFSLYQKLFGYGPDTYLIVSERTFYEEMVKRYGEVYDSAHNEYINYLICEGALGLIAYMGILISSIKLGLKNMKNNPFIIACVMAVISYSVQAVVNIAIPITTPIFFTIMYMCAREELQYKNIKNINEKVLVL